MSLWLVYLVVFGALYAVIVVQTAWNAWISTRPNAPYEVRWSWCALVDSVTGPAWWAPLFVILASPVLRAIMAVREVRTWMRSRDSCSKLEENPPADEGETDGQGHPLLR